MGLGPEKVFLGSVLIMLLFEVPDLKREKCIVIMGNIWLKAVAMHDQVDTKLVYTLPAVSTREQA